MTALLSRSVVITETNDGWELLWSDDATAHADTANEALEIVKMRDTSDCEDGGALGCVTTIEWEPASRVGRAVVEVIAS